MPGLRRLTPTTPSEGARLVEEWGYPRPLTLTDWIGEWYRVGRWAYVWLTTTDAPGRLLVHMSTNPEYRRKGWPFKKALDELTNDILPVLHPGGGVLLVHRTSKEIEPYLPRLGFERGQTYWTRSF